MMGQSGAARRKSGLRQSREPSFVVSCLLSFGCGIGLFVLLMVVFAFLLDNAPIPPVASRPLASLAAAAGAALSGYVLGCRQGSRYLLCGLGCGVFYLVCLAAAGLLCTGQLCPVQATSYSMPAVMLLLGGILGGAAASLKGSG